MPDNQTRRLPQRRGIDTVLSALGAAASAYNLIHAAALYLEQASQAGMNRHECEAFLEVLYCARASAKETKKAAELASDLFRSGAAASAKDAACQPMGGSNG